MQNIPHELGFISCPNAPCGLSSCSRNTPHFHCRLCGFGTSQIGNAVAHGRLCTSLDLSQKDYNLSSCAESMYSVSSQPFSFYPQVSQTPTPSSKIITTQQNAVFNFVLPTQNPQYSGLYGPQTVFPNPNLFSPSGFNNFSQMDSSWINQTRILSANVQSMTTSSPESAPNTSTSNCCRMENGNTGVPSLLVAETYKNSKDNQNWYNSSQSITNVAQQKYPDSTTSSCSISLLFLEQNKDSEECINVDDICFTPKGKEPLLDPCLEETTLSSQTPESDIVVEESDSESSEEINLTHCCVCNKKTPSDCYTQLNEKIPLTPGSKTSVYNKLTTVIELKNCSNSVLCSKCLDLINLIDSLEVKLSSAVKEIKSIYQSAKENTIVQSEDVLDKSIVCEICNKNFSSAIYLAKHKQHHTKSFSYCCEYCGKGFTTIQKLEKHILLHSNTLKFQCELCGKQFLARNSLTNHILQHKGQFKYFCPICEKGFVQKSVLKIHLQTHGDSFFVCQHCGKKVRTHSNLQVHIRICSGNMKHFCEKCNKSFPIKSLLEKHISMEHRLNFRFVCKICQKGFWKESDLKSHSNTHVKEKKFKCGTCGNMYKSKKNLTHHMRFHNGPQFKCKICGKKFTRADALTDHMNGHSGRKPYQCTTCWKRFANRINFNVHVKKHGNSRTSSKCLICKKIIHGSMSEHVKVHNERKCFSCKFCPALFAFKNSMVKHLKAKHGQFKENIS